MSTRCANSSCADAYRPNDGKLFSVDFEIANKDGATHKKTVFVWLCSRCARRMNPEVRVDGDTVKVLLAAIRIAPASQPAPTADRSLN